jgi:hypothetical protein
MSQEPSTQEEKWFYEQEQAKLAQARLDAAKATAVAEREAKQSLHYMKCPKCGGDLQAVDHDGIELDRCVDCSGMWFDAGEMDKVIAQQKGSGFLGLFRK